MRERSAPRRVLLVSDDAASIAIALEHLGAARFRVAAVKDAASGRAALKRRPSALVIDVTLPDRSGFALCQQIARGPREHPPRILLLTRPESVADRVDGFEAGADDCLAKPFSGRELVLRVIALLRRAPAPRSAVPERISIGRVSIDRVERRALVDGRVIALTPREIALLVQLAQSPGFVRTRQALLEGTWRDARGVIMRLREKLRVAGVRIETVRGVGYRLRSDDARAE